MELLNALTQIAQSISSHFGPDCEVVIHDLQDNTPDHSIVYIENGHVTNRNIGDGLFGKVLEVISQYIKDDAPADKIHEHPGFLTRTSDGKILKCSISYIHDAHDKLHYIFEINYDISKLTMIESAMHALTTPAVQKPKPKKVTHSVNDLLDHLIEESVALVGKPVALMNKEDKVTAIQFLNDSGAFLITRSGDKVASYFGISKYTLYSYIDVNK